MAAAHAGDSRISCSVHRPDFVLGVAAMGDKPVRKAFHAGERQFITAEQCREDIYVGMSTLETIHEAHRPRHRIVTAMWVFVIFGLGVLCGLLLANWIS